MLQHAQISITGRGLLDSARHVVLADIRDGAAPRRTIFADRRPEVVFHAAALKHLPLLEQYPDEAWKTNVLGTLNVLERGRTRRRVTLREHLHRQGSKPDEVLGHSKRVAEKLTAWMAGQTGRNSSPSGSET